MTAIETMIKEAKEEKIARNGNIGFSRRYLKDGTVVGCQVRTSYTGGGERIGERIEWLVNGTRRSKKVVEGLFERFGI